MKAEVKTGQSFTGVRFERYTLAAEFSLSGVGLHSGVATTVKVLPAAAGQGRYFVRVDLPAQPVIPAQVEAVTATVLSTQLSQGEACVRTVEHLLAALAGMGVDDARIEIDGAEAPLLDGSAKLWVEQIGKVGIAGQSLTLECLSSPLSQPLWIYEGDAFVAAIPAPETRYSYGIDFDSTAIGNQWYSWSPAKKGKGEGVKGKGEENSTGDSLTNLGDSSFALEIAPARTFGLAHQIEYLRQQGLIKGGTLDNALVCDRTGWLNPPLRFANEPVRHKILDLVGDLSLVKNLPTAHFMAYKASHNLHVQLAQQLEQKIKDKQ